ncbi:MAG TPA: MFS transporter [Mycobacteriales bacterium]|jgi:MFS family permease|nr:MFS transporter [Mycobacteriales bacterium]
MAQGTAARVQRTYLTLVLLTTLSASLIWGINTLFLLDAGLSNLEAFGANAFFTAGMVLFEVPTGVVADLRGRRVSFLLGALTLALSTLLYVLMWQVEAPFWAWAVASVLLGLGFTFFSGAMEAWLVDALTGTGYTGELDTVFGRGQAVEGVAMLSGSVLGGIVAQATNLGVPFVLRAALLGVTFALAFVLMHDIGFTPARGRRPGPEVKRILDDSLRYGLGRPAIRWIMLTSPFVGGVSIYAFYAMQPYLLELYGDPEAYGVAGLAAAIVAGAQIAGGLLAPRLRGVFRRRTSLLLTTTAIGVVALLLISVIPSFVAVIALLVLWSMAFATEMPVRQAYLNQLIPSPQRATVLSFDSLLASGGGVVIQPAFGRAADVWGYPATFALSAGVQALALPFIRLAQRERSPADRTVREPARPVTDQLRPTRCAEGGPCVAAAGRMVR